MPNKKDKEILSRNLNKLKPIIVRILKKNGVTKAGIFGSYARREQKKKSDIDILVKTKKSMSLLGFSHIKTELEDALGRKVDLVEYSTIKPLIKEQILNEEIRVI